MPQPAPYCPQCTIPGGWCAPHRCYCGHKQCPAYASYISRDQIKATTAKTNATQHAQSWAQREEATWLDRL